MDDDDATRSAAVPTRPAGALASDARRSDPALATTAITREVAPRTGEDLDGDTDLGALRAIAGMAAQPLLAPGSELDAYVIEAPLGAGGMGVVYRARDRRLGRDVAIKLHARTGDADGTARLLREARAMATLTHPNVATIYEVGTHEGHLFIAMAYLDGGTVRSWLTARPRTWREIVALYVAAGRGLAAAHRAGLVHRDFKPDNVLLGSDGQVRVADFGLARLRGERPSPAAAASDEPISPSITLTGVVLGTPLYMAPEQRRGDVGPAADQFAFCVALWEALAGAPPFAGKTTGELDLATRAQRFEPPAPGRVIPGHLRRALMRGLATDPAARFPSMDALLTAITRDPARTWRRALAGGALGLGAIAAAITMSGNRTPAAVAAEDPCAGAEAQAAAVWTPARKAAIVSAMSAQGPSGIEGARITTTTLDYYLGQWVTLRTASCRAAPEARAARLACFDRALTGADALIGVLTEPSRSAVARAAAAINSLPTPEQCAATTTAPPEPPTAAIASRVRQIRAGLARARAQYQLHVEDGAAAMAAALLAQAITTGWPPLIGEAHLLRAEAEWNAGHDELARSEARRAFEIGTSANDRELTAVAAARLTMFQIDPQEGETWAQRALPLIAAALPGSVLEAQTRNSYGGWLDALGRSADAVTQHARALEILGALRLDRDVSYAETLRFMASSQAVIGRRDDAITNYRRAITLLEQLKGERSGALIQPLAELALVYLDRARTGDALDEATRATAIADGLRADHRLVPFLEQQAARAQLARGVALMALGRKAEAAAALGAAAGVLRPMLAPDDPDRVRLDAALRAAGARPATPR